MQQKQLLYIYYDIGNIPVIANQFNYNVISCSINDINIECINYFDLIWVDIPHNYDDIWENYADILTVLSIIEYSNPANYVITMFKNNNIENKWFMYGMPYKDVKSIEYGAMYEKNLRVYSNIKSWNNLIAMPWRYQRLPPGLKRRRFDYRYIVPVMLIIEVLENII